MSPAADGGTFDATGRGDMYITMPNDGATSRILLTDVLYASKMGVTLVSISKIDLAGYAALFYKGSLKIFLPTEGKKQLANIPVVNGLYRVEHDDRDVVAAVGTEKMTIGKLHRILGHIAPEKTRMMVVKGAIEGIRRKAMFGDRLLFGPLAVANITMPIRMGSQHIPRCIYFV
jgi:hypothetical protein